MIDFILDLLYTIFRIIITGLMIFGFVCWLYKEFKDAANLWK